MKLCKKVKNGDTVERNGVSMIVSEGCYYVLGDNADNSCDSRYWGGAVRGKKGCSGKTDLIIRRDLEWKSAKIEIVYMYGKYLEYVW